MELFNGVFLRSVVLFVNGSPEEDVVDTVMAKVSCHDHRCASFVNFQGSYHQSGRSLIVLIVKLVYGKENQGERGQRSHVPSACHPAKVESDTICEEEFRAIKSIMSLANTSSL